MPQRRAASETSSHGTCSAPGSTSGAWISSARTQTSRSAQRSAITVSSDRGSARPVGLWGLDSTSTRMPWAQRRVELFQVDRPVGGQGDRHRLQTCRRELAKERRIGGRGKADRLTGRGDGPGELAEPEHDVG